MVILLYTELSEVIQGCLAGGWPDLEGLRQLDSHFLVFWWGWLRGCVQMGLLTGVSTCHHSSIEVSGPLDFLHSGFVLPESVSKQEVEAAPPLSPGLRNWHSHNFCHIALLKGARVPPRFQRRGHRCQLSMRRVSRNMLPSLICHTTTPRKISTLLADRQAPHDPILDRFIPFSSFHFTR